MVERTAKQSLLVTPFSSLASRIGTLAPAGKPLLPVVLIASVFSAGCASVFDDPDAGVPYEAPPTTSVPATTTTVPSTNTQAEAEENIAFASEPSVNLQDPNAYVLGNGDEISILVFDETDLTMDAAIGDSGEINYSYLGALKVVGKTPVQLEREITTALRDGYLVNPSVNVSIKTYRPFFINGEVRSPGG